MKNFEYIFYFFFFFEELEPPLQSASCFTLRNSFRLSFLIKGIPILYLGIITNAGDCIPCSSKWLCVAKALSYGL